MNFTDPTLEKIVRRWKWTRNNSILLFESAQKQNILNYVSKTDQKVSYTFQPILFQFQCLVTTTDAYYRKLSKSSNTSYGILVLDDQIVNKKDTTIDIIKNQLKKQMLITENLLKSFTSKNLANSIEDILAISNHEYLHQGQLIIMFREAGVDLPERFRKAWAL